METINNEFINKQAIFLDRFEISFADAAIECIYSIMDPEAPSTKEVALKFAENRSIKFDEENSENNFTANWEEINQAFLTFIESIKEDDALFAEKCKTVSSLIASEIFKKKKASGLCELIIGSMDLIVFVYHRFYELKKMIQELFHYEGDDTDGEFTKIIENTCLIFSQECRHTDDNKVEETYFDRVSLLFGQAILLSSIALMSRRTRENAS